MAKYRGPVCRLCRREGEKLFLKGTRCMTEKCAIERRSYPPGQHGQARPRISDYSTQLREKQKLRRIYGLQERQFRGVFERAERQSGVTGEALLRLLECRLDNVTYRLGFGASRKEARQLVGHGHVTVNGRKTNIPGAQVRAGDVVAVRERSRTLVSIQASLDQGSDYTAGQRADGRRVVLEITATSYNAGLVQNASQKVRRLTG